jgi:hypothetical protein
MKKILFICLLISFHTTTFASDVKTPKTIVETFFNQLQNGEISVAYDDLLKGSSIPTDKPQAVTVLKQQTQSRLPLYGKILRFELIREEQISDSVVRLVYFLISEKAPTTWEFYFYKPESKWFIANVIFNDQFRSIESKQ